MSELAPRTRSCPMADDVIAILGKNEPELRAAGIKRRSLFGSVARGDADLDSDIDIAVVLDPAAQSDLIGLIGLEERIGELVGRKVDLVPEPVEKLRLRANIERDRKLAF